MPTGRRPAVGQVWKHAAAVLRGAMASRTPRMTQGQLAEATGISQAQLSQYLRAAKAPNFDEIEAICAALDLAGDDLYREARIHAAGTAAERDAFRRAVADNDPHVTQDSRTTRDNSGQTGT